MDKTTDETKISLIGKDIEYIRTDIKEIKQSVKDLAGVYASQVKLDETTNRVKKLEESSNLWRWLAPLLSSLISAGVTFLFLNYLQNIK